MKARCILPAGLLVLAGCALSGSPEAVLTPSPTPQASPSLACSNQQDILADESARLPGPSVDVDGDGQRDELFVAADPAAPAGCAAFVGAETASGTLSVPIADDIISFELGLPVINSAHAIDNRPGAEVVVDIAAGASAQFVGVFTVREGELVRVEIEGQPSPAGGLISYGGSVGHLAAVDCAGPARVVLSNARPRGRSYLITRRFYDAQKAVWLLERGAGTRLQVPFRRIGSFPEFSAGPFYGCAPSEG
ncbi:MAG: hypothetical protein H0V97_10760 [Actinobacteria bacterium]|nr:hypothetical protein [Actinomycetota bacterium]